MANVTLIDLHGHSVRPPVQALQAEALLGAIGVDCGGWSRNLASVSSVPQLSYARELLTLQKRYGAVMTQRHRIAVGQTWNDPVEQHEHDDVELRVVVQGQLRMCLLAPALGGWLRLELAACEWVALPSGLPHAAAPDPAHGVDLLCLYTQPGGWRARASGHGPAPVPRPDVGPRAAPQVVAQAGSGRWRSALAA